VTLTTEQTYAYQQRFGVSRESWAKLEIYVGLLLEWQPHINLIAPSTIPHVWERHVADSLQLQHYMPKDTKTIADLGSGGGLPGAVLACTTDALVHFYESNGKKVAFLKEVLRKTGARGEVHQTRLEALKEVASFACVDVVTARALAPLEVLIPLAEPFLRHGASGFFHKGQHLDAELTQASKSWTIEYIRHPSMIDSLSVVLEVRGVSRVES
jgi:16S rRNA (guanine527-N7)-methyltransferase